MTTTHTIRRADLQTLVNALQHEAAHRLDVIVPAHRMRYGADGTLSFDRFQEASFDESGVTPARDVTEQLVPTEVAKRQLGDKLGIPSKYWDKCEADEPGLLSTNVQTWLSREPDSYLVRGVAYPNGGIARAVLSDSFHPIDNIDVLMATLEGVQMAGLSPDSLSINGDLSDRRMYVRIDAPAVTVDALDLAARYVDPRTGRTGLDHPLVSAGVIIRNSDVGHGAFTVTPRITFLVCKNGMTRTDESMRKIHVGSQNDEGVINWSDDTMRKQLAVVTAKSRDAVAQFLTVDYLQSVCNELRGISRTPILDPLATVTEVTKKLGFSKDHQQLILNAFVQSGDMSPLGVAQAFTHTAQHKSISADMASEMEDAAWRAMTLAAA